MLEAMQMQIKMLFDMNARLEKEVRELRALLTPFDPGSLPPNGPAKEGT